MFGMEKLNRRNGLAKLQNALYLLVEITSIIVMHFEIHQKSSKIKEKVQVSKSIGS